MSLFKSFREYQKPPCHNYLTIIKEEFGEDWEDTIKFADWLKRKTKNRIDGRVDPCPCFCDECVEYHISHHFTINGQKYGNYTGGSPRDPDMLSFRNNLESVYEDWLIEELEKSKKRK